MKKLNLFAFIFAFVAMLAISTVSFAAPPAPNQFDASGNWVSTAAIALIASAALLALIYMVGHGFEINELKMLANEELYQLVVTIVIIGLLLGSTSILNSFSSTFAPSGATNFQDAAISAVRANLADHQSIYNNLKSFSVELGKESSKSYFCSLQGVGFYVSPCSAFSSISPSVSLAFQILSASIAELNSLDTLLNFAKTYGFAVLLPFGILLRTLKFTRGAGGLFLGLAVSLYIVLPLLVIFMDVLLNPATGYNPTAFGIQIRALPIPECDETSFGTVTGGISYDNYDAAVGTFQSLLNNVKTYIYYALVRGTMLLVVSLLGFFSAFRAISKVAGAEVDISSLMRIS
ncbi:MAG: hypothetical protein AABX38_05915 [Candidatus Micrarchaeota archaeon]